MQKITDLREFVFPIFLVYGDDTSFSPQGREYLGTGFFITNKGDAATAAHVIPDQIPPNQRLIAVVVNDGKEIVCWLQSCAKFDAFDFAMIKVNIDSSKFFTVMSERLDLGCDVSVIGIPTHESTLVEAGKKQMRYLKGHVVAGNGKLLELSFAVPAGMSGAPLIVNDNAIGYATGRVRGEELEESTEEVIRVSNQKEVIQLIQTKRITYYGVAREFAEFVHIKFDCFQGLSVLQFIEHRNKSN